MHPRSTCSHAFPGSTPAMMICELKVLPDDSHVGGCVSCGSNTNSCLRAPVPWPEFAQRVRAGALPEDVGIGDTAAREIAKLGLVGFAVAYNVKFGPSCGCMEKEWNEGVRERWNTRYNYSGCRLKD